MVAFETPSRERAGLDAASILPQGNRDFADLGTCRFRSCDPTQGRFLTLDPASGVSADPLSLHKYAYCQSDPVNLVDPTGMFSVAAAVVVGIGVVTALVGIGLVLRNGNNV